VTSLDPTIISYKWHHSALW